MVREKGSTRHESEINGVRTAAAMAEAARQGYFPGWRPPYGFRSRPVVVRDGVVRHAFERISVGVASTLGDGRIALGFAKRQEVTT